MHIRTLFADNCLEIAFQLNLLRNWIALERFSVDFSIRNLAHPYTIDRQFSWLKEAEVSTNDGN